MSFQTYMTYFRLWKTKQIILKYQCVCVCVFVFLSLGPDVVWTAMFFEIYSNPLRSPEELQSCRLGWENVDRILIFVWNILPKLSWTKSLKYQRNTKTSCNGQSLLFFLFIYFFHIFITIQYPLFHRAVEKIPLITGPGTKLPVLLLWWRPFYWLKYNSLHSLCKKFERLFICLFNNSIG